MERQWQKRVKLFQFAYNMLMTTNLSSEEKMKKVIDFNLDGDWLQASDYLVNHFETIIKDLKKYISEDWTFERCSKVDQALLIAAYAEFYGMKTDKKIVIDQSLITAHKFSDSTSFKYINAILDQALN
ncbi:transcription antitermination factor NusB [Ureaplasma canigenitalium]|uniref:transcription antitermination factor NusB n=1 Tax=Ureaplasma canigenitalium TaxID=42092 RepID=UPI0004E1E9B6|nr:transcription antitermination factor NusB [Ureaplasma canigenitalium]